MSNLDINLSALNHRQYQRLQGGERVAFDNVLDNIRSIARIKKNAKELAITSGELEELKGIIKKVINSGQYKIIKTNILEICQYLLEVNLKENCKNTDFYGLYSVNFYFNRDIKSDFKCYYGWFSSAIGISGHVSLCCIKRSALIGNVYDKSFKEIWNSKDAHKVRLSMKNDFDLKKKSWRECTYCTNIQLNNDIGNLLSGK